MKNNKIYASMLINGSEGWGDAFPALWFSEYLFEKNSCSIDLLDYGSADTSIIFRYHMMNKFRSFHNSTKKNTSLASTNIKQTILDKFINQKNILFKSKFRHSNFIFKPYFIERFLDQFPRYDDYDEVLVTHHNHHQTNKSWASPFFFNFKPLGLLPPCKNLIYKKCFKFNYMDANADLLNILAEGFRPTMPLLKDNVLNPLKNLPKKYISVQSRFVDTGPLGMNGALRNFYSKNDYIEFYNKYFRKIYNKYKLPIIFTSDYFKIKDIEQINLSSLNFWSKIELHRRSQYSYVSHSGFGMIVSIYRNLKNTFLINFNEEARFRNPPVELFNNNFKKTISKKFKASPPGWIIR
jgi:hypothetical protein